MASQPEESLSPAPFLAGLFLITAAVLALEVLDTRLLSVLTWYSLAFLVIAMGLFGLTVGALRVYLREEGETGERLSHLLASGSLAFAIAIPASLILFLVVPLRISPVATTFFLFVVFAAVIALPFIPAGVVIAAALTRTSFPIGRIYAVDLLGAAAGAWLVPLLLRLVDGSTAILALSLLAGLASACFARAGRDPAGVRRGLLTTVAVLLLCAANGIGSAGLKPLWVKGVAEVRSSIEIETWNTHSRITAGPAVTGRAMLWGIGANCETTPIRQRRLAIDGEAATYLYDVPLGSKELDFLRCDVTNVVHHLRPSGPVAIIGVGGSRDIQSALLFGHSRVVGIEMNGRLLEILKGPLGEPAGVARHPSVKLIHDEGRSWLARTPERFTVVQASLVDTWAATGAGAYALGENGLYTLEAWRTFVDRLEPGGVFTVSRWFANERPDETARLLSLAIATLLDRGVANPRAHVAIVAARHVATLLLARDPFSPEDVDRLARVAQASGFDILAAPGRSAPSPFLRAILDSRDRETLDRTALTSTLDFRPPTDERPFFFNVVRLAAFHRLPPANAGFVEGNRIATTTLVLAILASCVLTLAAILVPLALKARPTGSPTRPLAAALAYFTLIGLGFMLAEIGLLQRLSVVLGHPVYSLLVVLPAVVAATGLGSLLSDRLPLDRAPACYLFPVAIAALLTVTAIALPRLAPLVQPASLAVRAGFALAVSGLLGIGLGLAFPAGMRLVRGRLGRETPWFWGMNGAGSVLGGGAAMVVSLTLGIPGLFVIAALLYLLLIPAIALVRQATE